MNMRRILLTALVLFFTVSGAALLLKTGRRGIFRHPGNSGTPAAVSASAPQAEPLEETAKDPYLPEDIATIQDTGTTVPIDTIPGSITCLVNRNYLLPSSYTPSNLIEPKIQFSFDYQNDKRKLRKPAAKALEKMFNAAKKKNLILCGVSGYRSYERQRQIYLRNISLYGSSATDTFSAKPGSSEHQTGLTIDISCRQVNYLLVQDFAKTKEGKWVIKNAHKYGYIIRYPSGKSEVTGYHYEPWHIRYVGVDLATYLYNNNMTMEEYYGVSCDSSEEDSQIDVEDINDTNNANTPSKKKQKG